MPAHFGIGSVCVVADAGMISKKQIAAIEARGWRYILGARPRATKEVREVVLGDEAPFGEIEVERRRPKPMKLEVKEVVVGKDEEGPAPRYSGYREQARWASARPESACYAPD